MNKNILVFFIAALFTFAIFPLGVNASYTLIPNGSFESGDLTNWEQHIDWNESRFLVTMGVNQNSYGSLYPTDGNFFGYMHISHTQLFQLTSDTLCSDSNVVLNGQTVDYNFTFGSSNWAFNSYLYLTSTPASKYNASGNQYVTLSTATNLAPTFYTGTFSAPTSDKYLCFQVYVPSDGGSYARKESHGMIDNLKLQVQPTLINTITTSDLPRNVLETGYIYVSVLDSFGNVRTDATVNVNFNSAGNVAATYDSSIGKYKFLVGGLGTGTYNYIVTTSKTGYVTDTDNGTWSVAVNPSNLATNCITNCTITPTSTGVLLSLTNKSLGATWKVVNNNPISVLTKFSWTNDRLNAENYSVYTSIDGINWVFSDTLTFGATVSSPLQKVWNSTTNTYDFNFTESISSGQTKYYKIVLQSPAYYTEVINNSNDWFNQNPPTNYRDAYNKNLDVFSDSNLTNIQSYTIFPFQNLVSNDLTVGYILQFTAYATTNGTLKVGYRPYNTTGGSDVTSDVPVTTTPTRYSVAISPAARDSSLIIKSLNSTSNTFYIRDYSIVPRSYFLNQLEILNPDYTTLNPILRNGVSTKYVLEGQQVRIRTSAYDTQGNLTQLELITYIDGVQVKSQLFNLTSTTGNLFNFNQLIEGAIDLNGIGGDINTLSPLRSITYKAVLKNSSNQSVSEQYSTASILQYPYFPNDLKMTLEVPNTKQGTNPIIQFSIKQKTPSNLIGFDVALYDTTHTQTSPNYYERILFKDLQCTDTTNCTVQIVLDKYVWENTGVSTNFVVGVTALLSTENKNYIDPYANIYKSVLVTPASYKSGQLFQYYERRNASPPQIPYKPTEKVPLVLGMVDDTRNDLTNKVFPYFTLSKDDTNDLVIDEDFYNKYYPDASRYDAETGATYWLWNQYFTDDTGNLFNDGDNVYIHAVAIDQSQTQNQNQQIGFSPRCVKYPFDSTIPLSNFLKGSINFFGYKLNYDFNPTYNLVGANFGTLGLNGCSVYPDSIVQWDGNAINFSTSTVPSANQGHNIYCGQTYDNNTIIDNLGDEFSCIAFIKEDEEQIDGLNIKIGNENSDYSVLNDSIKQYISFSIPQTDIMFTDLSSLIQNWSSTGSPDDQQNAWDILKRWTNDLHLGQSIMTLNDINSTYGLKWSAAIGNDTNFSLYRNFNSNQFNKVILFKVSGLNVINAYDYLTPEQRYSFNYKNFLSYAAEKNLPINPNKVKITLYNNSNNPFKVIETKSQLVINQTPTAPQKVLDSNRRYTTTTLPAILGIQLISDLSSASQTKNQRLMANMQFKKIITAEDKTATSQGNPVPDFANWVKDTLNGKDENGKPDGLFNAPIRFITNPLNVTVIIILLGLLFLISLTMRNIAPIFNKGV